MTSPTRLYLSPPHMTGREQQYVAEAFATNWIAPIGPHLDRFEQKFAQRVGMPQAVGVTTGTAALHLALRLLGLAPGDEVISSTLTFCATANPIVYERAQPVFIDSDRRSWNMDPNLLAEELAERAAAGRLPRAVVVADILGQPADLDAILQIAGEYELPVIDDAAEALGATYKNRPVGSQGWVSCFSFNGNKIITTSNGGMFCTADGALAERARYLATQARDPVPYYQHTQIGYNYRLSNVLAAIGLAQLEALDERVEARRKIREYYGRHLAAVPGIRFMPQADYGQPNYWLTVIQVDPQAFGADCEELRQALERENIEARRVWKPLHMQPVFAGCRVRGGGVAEEIFQTALCLPSGSAMTEEDLARVVEAILAVHQQAPGAGG